MGNFINKPDENIFEIAYPDKIQFYKTDKQSVNGYIYLFFKPTKNITIDSTISKLIANYMIKNYVKTFELSLNNLTRVVTQNGSALETTASNDNIHLTIRFNNKRRVLETTCVIPTKLYITMIK